jgi:hypothetical protein
MGLIILSFVACLAQPYFSTLSHKGQYFRRKKKYWRKNVFFFYNFSLKHFLFWKELSKISQMHTHRSSLKCPLFLSAFNETWILNRFSKNNQISWKSVQWEPSFSMRTDGRTDGQKTDRQTKLIVAFHNFANALKKASLRHPACLYMSVWQVVFIHTTANMAYGGSAPGYQDICWKKVMVKRPACPCA